MAELKFEMRLFLKKIVCLVTMPVTSVMVQWYWPRSYLKIAVKKKKYKNNVSACISTSNSIRPRVVVFTVTTV